MPCGKQPVIHKPCGTPFEIEGGSIPSLRPPDAPAHLRSSILFPVLLFCLAGLLPASTPEQAAPRTECRCTWRGGWLIADTANFSVWCRLGESDARTLASRLEALRGELLGRWQSDSAPAIWSPRCIVVVHDTRGEYVRGCGDPNAQSVGCTTVTTDGGQVIFRRIDLRRDASDWQVNALPHELTHVVLADVFRDAPLPAWLNEGLAMLSETRDLQARRYDTLTRAIELGTAPPLRDVVSNPRDSRRTGVELRYAASFAVVKLLYDRRGAQVLLEFCRQASASDQDQALRVVYGIDGGLAELEREWLRELVSESRTW